MESIKTITELSLLNDGWDSYEAPKPNELAVKRAKRLLSSLSSYKLHPEKIMASVEGGIYFLLLKGNKYADIECDNDGDIIAYIHDRISEPEIWIIGNNDREINNSLVKIQKFLAG
jgi:hypothetical protein